ncbi:MAG: type I 3-dehydroquinate dehydratase [Spirochaetales bacterium]|nr:type I 3-dehydroquinate dehydratase [Spirochaetales bacterium]
MIFLTLTERTISENLEQVKDCEACIRGLELRVDLLDADQLDLVYEFPSMVDLPVILTVRKKIDGGEYDGSEEDLLEIYRNALASGYTYFDLDDTINNPALFDQALSRGIKIIRSFHDFEMIPADFISRVRDNYKKEYFIPKAAVAINSTADLYNYFKLCDSLYDIPEKILIGMGSFGFSTRVLTHLTGSLISYTSFNNPNPQLGHISPVKLCQQYRYNQIEDTTNICGIIGNPVMHSKSPELHNSWYSDQQIDYVYLPFQTDNIETFLKLAEFLKIRGLSVTLPFKTEIIEYLDEVDDSVKKIGSCNTVVFQPDSSSRSVLQGFNTDYLGFIKPLHQFMLKKESKLEGKFLAGKKACVIGAGGASRSVIFGLLKYGAEVDLYNRTIDKAEQVARDFGIKAFELKDLQIAPEYDIVVQTSSAGMGELAEIDPSHGYRFSGKEIAYDIIYTPEKTKFLARAEESGASILNGVDMLIKQAEYQHQYFTKGKITAKS